MLFGQVSKTRMGLLHLSVPDPASFDWRTGVLTVLAFLLAFGAKWSVPRLLAKCGAGGIALGLVV